MSDTKEQSIHKTEPPHFAVLRKRAALGSTALAVTLLLSKIVAAYLTRSSSVLSSLVDSLADVVASLVTLFGVSVSSKPLDEEHRYGHEKAEALSSMGQSVFIAGSAMMIVIDGIGRLISPVAIQRTGLGMGIMFWSFSLTACLMLYQRYVVKETGSRAIRADMLNYRGDLATAVGVIISLAVVRFTHWLWFDAMTALVIAAYMLRNAWIIGLDATAILMDKELPEEVRQEIVEVVMQDPLVLGVHDMRTRSAGQTNFVEMHLEFDGSFPLTRVHNISDKAEARLRKHFANLQIIIHQDPLGLYEQRLDVHLENAKEG